MMLVYTNLFSVDCEASNPILIILDRLCHMDLIYLKMLNRCNINGRDVQRKNVVNNVDKSSLWAP